MHAHLLADQIHAARRPVVNAFLIHVLVNRDCGLVTVCDGPDNIFGTKGRITAEEHALSRTHHRSLVDDRAVPLIEIDANIPLDPRKRVVLTDRENDVVARNHDFSNGATPVDIAVVIDLVFHPIKFHSDKFAVLDDKLLR